MGKINRRRMMNSEGFVDNNIEIWQILYRWDCGIFLRFEAGTVLIIGSFDVWGCCIIRWVDAASATVGRWQPATTRASPFVFSSFLIIPLSFNSSNLLTTRVIKSEYSEPKSPISRRRVVASIAVAQFLTLFFAVNFKRHTQRSCRWDASSLSYS